MSSTNYQSILFYGPPSSGKGTQAYLLSKKYDIELVDAGHSFRSFVQNNSTLERAIRVKKHLDNGIPILTEDYFHILEQSLLGKMKSTEKFILDKPGGSLVPEAEWFNKLILENQTKTILIVLKLDLEKAIERAGSRWIIKGVQKSYMSKEKALEVAKNPKDVYQRKDDLNIEKITSRYNKLFSDNQKEILALYKTNPYVKIVEVSADVTIEAVHQEILNNL